MGREFVSRPRGEGIEISDYEGEGGEIIIPREIDLRPVIAISEGAFYQRSSLTSVTIPDSVTSIGNGAFSYCGSLALVTVEGNVTRIGDFAFAFCTSLSSIVFMGDLPPFAGESWILGTPAEIRGHAYAKSHFPEPRGAFSGLTMGDVIVAPIQQLSHRTAAVSPEFTRPETLGRPNAESKDEFLKNSRQVPPQQSPRDRASVPPTQKIHCRWCGTDSYGIEKCDFCGGKRGN